MFQYISSCYYKQYCSSIVVVSVHVCMHHPYNHKKKRKIIVLHSYMHGISIVCKYLPSTLNFCHWLVIFSESVLKSMLVQLATRSKTATVPEASVGTVITLGLEVPSMMFSSQLSLTIFLTHLVGE